MNRTLGREDRATLLLNGLFSLSTGFTVFLLPIYLVSERGFSGAEVGGLLSAFFVIQIAAAVPVGLGADRFRPRHLMWFALVCLAAAGGLLAVAERFVAALAGFLALGAASSLFKQVIDALWYRRRTARAGVGGHFGPFLAARVTGAALGLVLGGWGLRAFGFVPMLFGLSGAAAVLALLVPLLPDVRLTSAQLRDYAVDLARPAVLFMAVWLFLFTSHWGAEATSYARFVREDLGLSLPWTGAYMGVEFVSLAAGTVAAGRYLDHHGPDLGLLVGGMALSGFFQVAMLVDDPILSVVMRAAHGVGDGAVMLVLYATVGRLFAAERVGGNAGFALVITMLGAAAGSAVYGPLGASHGNATPLLVSGVGLVLLGPLVLLGRRALPT